MPRFCFAHVYEWDNLVEFYCELPPGHEGRHAEVPVEERFLEPRPEGTDV